MGTHRHQCADCRAAAKRLGHTQPWPEWVYHSQPTKLCVKHHAQKLSDGARRRFTERSATALWANNKAIKGIYAEAQRLTDSTGVRHEVDHVVPLRGQRVSGLHVESNLQIIPRAHNARKSNNFTVE